MTKSKKEGKRELTFITIQMMSSHTKSIYGGLLSLLGLVLGSAFNIVASSLDTHDEVVKKYKKAKSNLIGLTELVQLK